VRLAQVACKKQYLYNSHAQEDEREGSFQRFSKEVTFIKLL
jgi:hypothetical protein